MPMIKNARALDAKIEPRKKPKAIDKKIEATKPIIAITETVIRLEVEMAIFFAVSSLI